MVKKTKHSQNQPLVSIGMPIFNGEKFLPKTLDSLLAQDYANFEIVISDNASTDSTRDICLAYAEKDKRIHYHLCKEHIGMVKNGNRALRLSSGDFFMWAADHDLYDPGYISKGLEVMLQEPSVVLVYGYTMLIDEEDKHIGLMPDRLETRGLPPVERFKKVIWTLGYCNAIYGLMRMKDLKQTSWGQDVIASDNVLLAELSLAGEIVQLEEPLFFRRQNRPKEDDQGRVKRQLEFVDPYAQKIYFDLTWSEMAYKHIETVQLSPLISPEEKAGLVQEVVNYLKLRLGHRVETEIDGIIKKCHDYFVEHKLPEDFPSTQYLAVKGMQALTGLLPFAANIHRVHQAISLCGKVLGLQAGFGEGEYSLPEPEELFISVVIPTYNRAGYLKEAIESVLAQNCVNMEILVIDDGSTDNTAEVVNGFQSDQIRYIKKQKNEGRPKTRNVGIKEAKGNFILWLDDDDLLEPHTVQKYIDVLRKDPSCNLVYGKLKYFDDKTGKELRVFDPVDWSVHRNTMLRGMLNGCVLPNPATMIRKNIYDLAGGYDEDFLRAQDYEFWSRAYPYLTPRKVDAFVCSYRVHETNISAGSWVDLSYESQIIKNILSKYSLREIFVEMGWQDARSTEPSAYFNIAKVFFQYADFFNAKKFLEKIPYECYVPEMADLYLRCFLYMGELEQAEEYLDGLGRLKSMNAQHEGDLRDMAGKYGADLKHLDDLFLTGEKSKIVEGLQKSLNLYGNTFDIAKRLVQYSAMNKDWSNAFIYLKVAARCNPNSKEIPDLIGKLVLSDAQQREIADIQKRLTLHYDEPAARQSVIEKEMMHAEELYQAGKLSDAVDSLLRIIAKTPDDIRLYHKLIHIFNESEQFEGAYNIFKELPGHEEERKSLELKGVCLLGLGRLQEADELAKQLLEKNPKSGHALNMKGELAFREGNRDVAGDFFKQAIEADPEYGLSYTNLGLLHWDDQQGEASLGLLEKGFVLNPLSHDTTTNYHAAAVSMDELPRAQKTFAEALSQFPKNKRLTDLYTDILLRLKNYDAAMEQIEKSITFFGIDDGMVQAALKVREQLGPLDIEAAANKKKSVSACLIVKNEEKYLAKCLRSIKPIVDEIIVVDTGSADRTVDIARVFGAKLYSFEWSDDFSAARNYSISKASGSWVFIVDADEVVAAHDYQHFRELLKTKKKAIGYSFISRNYVSRTNLIDWQPNEQGIYAAEETGSGWVPSWKVRLVPNDTRFRFEFPVHEMLDYSIQRANGEIVKCDVPIHHYGNMEEAHKGEKGEAYYEIGKKKLQEEGDTAHALRELASQAAILEKYDEAVDLWKRFLALDPDSALAYVNLGTSYAKSGNYQEAMAASQKAVELAPDMREALCNLAISYLYNGNEKKAAGLYEKVLQRYPGYAPAIFKLAAVYIFMGDKEKSKVMFQKLKGHTPAGLAIACHEFAKEMASANMRGYAQSLLKAAIEWDYVNLEVLDLWKKMSIGERASAVGHL